MRWEVGFKNGEPNVQSALERNGIRVAVDARYNDGKRDITYHYVGELQGDHYDPRTEGQIIVKKDETD